MGIGIGGGIGPFRLGVSTRGIGGGIGPISAGTSWRSRRRSSSGGNAGVLAVLFVVLMAAFALYMVAAWPYLAGTAVAEGLGLGRNACVVVGWVCEGLYIVAVLVALVALGRRRQARAAAADAAAMHRAAVEAHERKVADLNRHEAALTRLVEQAPLVRDELVALRDRIERYPAGGEATDPEVAAHVSPGELVLGACTATLCAPRVAYRGGPRVQTDLETGLVVFTDHAASFHGTSRTERWPLTKIRHIQRTREDEDESSGNEPDRLLFTLSGRQTINGLSGDTMLVDVLEAMAAWAVDLPGRPERAIAILNGSIASVDEQVESCRQSLAKARELRAQFEASVPVAGPSR